MQLTIIVWAVNSRVICLLDAKRLAIAVEIAFLNIIAIISFNKSE